MVLYRAPPKEAFAGDRITSAELERVPLARPDKLFIESANTRNLLVDDGSSGHRQYRLACSQRLKTWTGVPS